MNVICRIIGHRPMLTDSVFDPTPEQCEEWDVVDLPTLHFTAESCERCDSQLWVGVGLPGEQIELVSPLDAAGRVAELTQATINQAYEDRFAEESDERRG